MYVWTMVYFGKYESPTRARGVGNCALILLYRKGPAGLLGRVCTDISKTCEKIWKRVRSYVEGGVSGSLEKCALLFGTACKQLGKRVSRRSLRPDMGNCMHFY
jgi:hypothetical protein